MRINNTYITNIACLQQVFKNSIHPLDLLVSFWAQRCHFAIDFSPKRIYYWDSEIDYIGLYNQICQFIKHFEDGDSSPEDEKIGIDNICSFIGIVPSLLNNKYRNTLLGRTDTSGNIIQIVVGGEYDFSTLRVPESDVTLKKIEVVGEDGVAKVILNDEINSVRNNQCLYAVSVNNQFKLLLPNKLSCDTYDLTLINVPGQFSSRLHKEAKNPYISPAEHSDVTSIAIINGKYYVYTDHNGNIISPSNYDELEGTGAKYVLSDNKLITGFALFDQGHLKKSFGSDEFDVAYAYYDKLNKLKVIKY